MTARPSKTGTPAPHVDGTHACADQPTDLFFEGKATEHRAKAICNRCPILTRCLGYALTAVGVAGVPVDGIWGGTTRDERKAIRAERGLGLAAGLVA